MQIRVSRRLRYGGAPRASAFWPHYVAGASISAACARSDGGAYVGAARPRKTHLSHGGSYSRRTPPRLTKSHPPPSHRPYIPRNASNSAKNRQPRLGKMRTPPEHWARSGWNRMGLRVSQNTLSRGAIFLATERSRAMQRESYIYLNGGESCHRPHGPDSKRFAPLYVQLVDSRGAIRRKS